MKKIKLPKGKLQLNKFTVAELNNKREIIGGTSAGNTGGGTDASLRNCNSQYCPPDSQDS